MTSSASPTVRRRRLAAELRRLRGGRTGTTVAKALGWSPAKVSRYELGQGTFPLEEIEKLLDYYGVTEPRRAQLLDLAAEANERAWWYDYADALSPAVHGAHRAGGGGRVGAGMAGGGGSRPAPDRGSTPARFTPRTSRSSSCLRESSSAG